MEYIYFQIISGKELFVSGKRSAKKTHERARSSKLGSRCWQKWLLKAATRQVSVRKAWDMSDSSDMWGRKHQEAVLPLQPLGRQETNDSSPFLRTQTSFKKKQQSESAF